MSFFATYPVFVPLVAVFVAESLKFAIASCKKRAILFGEFGHSGGMPSGHSTLASSIAMTAFLLKGSESIEFAISAAFALLVIYDSVKIRWEAGQHAKVLNYLLGQKKLDERLGHTFYEMLAGIFLGCAIAFLLINT